MGGGVDAKSLLGEEVLGEDEVLIGYGTSLDTQPTSNRVPTTGRMAIIGFMFMRRFLRNAWNRGGASQIFKDATAIPKSGAPQGQVRWTNSGAAWSGRRVRLTLLRKTYRM
jgi:hypothetical protein